jgi:hypothetical protein
MIFLDHHVATPEAEINNNNNSEPGGSISKIITLKV